jgi:hypothetical protein
MPGRRDRPPAPDRLNARPILRAFAISEASFALGLHRAHLGGVYRGRPPLVDARGLGLRDPLKLALAAQVRLEFGEHAQHVEEALAGRGSRLVERCSCIHGRQAMAQRLKFAEIPGNPGN